MNHFTNKDGYNAIASQPVWRFKAFEPLARHQPIGAYFTTFEPSEPNLAKKLFVPRSKLSFVFKFRPSASLLPLPGGRGRLGYIFYSPTDYDVDEECQDYAGETGLV